MWAKTNQFKSNLLNERQTTTLNRMTAGSSSAVGLPSFASRSGTSTVAKEKKSSHNTTKTLVSKIGRGKRWEWKQISKLSKNDEKPTKYLK